MTLSLQQKRAAADLYSRIDLLVNRSLPKLGEPFGLNIVELSRWKERLYFLAEDLRRARERGAATVARIEEMFAELPPGDEAFDFAAVEYPPEEARAKAEEDAARREAALRRERELREALRKAGVEAPEEEAADEGGDAPGKSGNDAGSEEESSSSETATTALAVGGENAAANAGESDAPEELSLDARKSLYREGYALLDSALRVAAERLMTWVRGEDAARFRAIDDETPSPSADSHKP